MFRFLVHRVLVMIPTLVIISALVFIIIQLPEGDYLSTYIAELESQGETVSKDKIKFLREQSAWTSRRGNTHLGHGVARRHGAPFEQLAG